MHTRADATCVVRRVEAGGRRLGCLPTCVECSPTHPCTNTALLHCRTNTKLFTSTNSLSTSAPHPSRSASSTAAASCPPFLLLPRPEPKGLCMWMASDLPHANPHPHMLVSRGVRFRTCSCSFAAPLDLVFYTHLPPCRLQCTRARLCLPPFLAATWCGCHLSAPHPCSQCQHTCMHCIAHQYIACRMASDDADYHNYLVVDLRLESGSWSSSSSSLPCTLSPSPTSPCDSSTSSMARIYWKEGICTYSS